MRSRRGGGGSDWYKSAPWDGDSRQTQGYWPKITNNWIGTTDPDNRYLADGAKAYCSPGAGPGWEPGLVANPGGGRHFADPTCPYRGIFNSCIDGEFNSGRRQWDWAPSNPFLNATIGLQASLPQLSNYHVTSFVENKTTASGLMLGNEMRSLTGFYRDCGLLTHMSGALLNAYYDDYEEVFGLKSMVNNNKNGLSTNEDRKNAVNDWNWDYNAYLQHVILKTNPQGSFPDYLDDRTANNDAFFIKSILEFQTSTSKIDSWKNMQWSNRDDHGNEFDMSQSVGQGPQKVIEVDNITLTSENVATWHQAGTPIADDNIKTGAYPNMKFTVQPVVTRGDPSEKFDKTVFMDKYGINGTTELENILAIRHLELSPFVSNVENSNAFGWALTGTFLPGMCICFDDHTDQSVIPYPDERQTDLSPILQQHHPHGTDESYTNPSSTGAPEMANRAVIQELPILTGSEEEGRAMEGDSYSVQYPMHHHMYFIRPDLFPFNNQQLADGVQIENKFKLMCLTARIRWATMRNTAFTLMETAAWGGVDGYKPVDWFDCNYKYQARGVGTNDIQKSGDITGILGLQGPPVVPNMYGYGGAYGQPGKQDAPLYGNGQVPQLVQNNAGYFTNVTDGDANGSCGGGQDKHGLRTFDGFSYDPYYEANTSPHAFCVQSVKYNGGKGDSAAVNSRSNVYFNFLGQSSIKRDMGAGKWGEGSNWWEANFPNNPYQLEKTYYTRSLNLFKNNANLPLRVNYARMSRNDKNYWGWTRTSFPDSVMSQKFGRVHGDYYRAGAGRYTKYVGEVTGGQFEGANPSEFGDVYFGSNHQPKPAGGESQDNPGWRTLTHYRNPNPPRAMSTAAFKKEGHWGGKGEANIVWASDAANIYNFDYGNEMSIGVGNVNRRTDDDIYTITDSLPPHASWAIGDATVPTGDANKTNQQEQDDFDLNRTSPAGMGTAVGLSPTHNIIQNLMDYNPYCQGEYIGEGIWRRCVYYFPDNQNKGMRWQYYNCGIKLDGTLDENVPLGGMWGEPPNGKLDGVGTNAGYEYTTAEQADAAIPFLFPWVNPEDNNLYTNERLKPNTESSAFTKGNYLIAGDDGTFTKNRSINAARCYRINAEMLFSQTWVNNYWSTDWPVEASADDCALRGLCANVDTHQRGSQVRFFPGMGGDSTIPDNVKVNISCWIISDDKELNFGLPMGLISGSPNSNEASKGGYSTCAPNSNAPAGYNASGIVAEHYKNNASSLYGDDQ